MAVGCAPGAVGAARTEAVSRAEVVIQPMLPLFVTPGDVFEASVSLTDMLDGKIARKYNLVTNLARSWIPSPTSCSCSQR